MMETLPEQYREENEILNSIITTAKLIGYSMDYFIEENKYCYFFTFYEKQVSINFCFENDMINNVVLTVLDMKFIAGMGFPKDIHIRINSYENKDHMGVLKKTFEIIMEA